MAGRNNKRILTSLGGSNHNHLNQSIGKSLYGMSMSSDLPQVGFDGDRQGLVFFTRPQLNMSSENISNVRELSNLLGNNPNSLYQWVRATLDPRLMEPTLGKLLGDVSTPLVNNKYGFIPVLSNLCTRVSGWPDRAVSVYVSNPGKYREVYMQVDGRSRMEGPVDLTVEFKRIPGNPISALLETWGLYPEYSFEGKLYPYADIVLANELEYNIRMFRFVMDISGRYIRRVGSTLPGIIMVSGQGSDFDFDRSKGATITDDTVSFPMKFPAVVQNDPRLLMDFNKITETFNVNMITGAREKLMFKIHIDLRNYFRGYLYPYINLNTNELESWVDASIAETIGAKMVTSGIIESLRDLNYE